MKKYLSLFLSLGIFIGCFAGCNGTEPPEKIDSTPTDSAPAETPADTPKETSDETPKETQTETPTDTEKEEEPEKPLGKEALQGKKVLVIGNSHTYFGKLVIEKTQSILTQKERSNDEGYFYQLCKANGVDVSVTNWAFGNHDFTDLFENCTADRGCDNVKHLDYLTDRNFDYVIMQQGVAAQAEEEFLEKCQMVMDIFKEANPDVKFVFLVQRRLYENQYQWRGAIKKLPEMGVMVADWGAIVDDVITGKTVVPGATVEFDQNSFIIRKSESDGYHPNMLAGYITALMAYCVITGEQAVGQPYEFATDKTISSKFNTAIFKSNYYKYKSAKTNFDVVLKSEADIRGIQALVDQYIEEKNYMYLG